MPRSILGIKDMHALGKKINAVKSKACCQKGFSLIEVVVALFVISLVTGVVLHSSILAVNTNRINKTKTLALASINEEIEKIRAMDYEDLGLIGGNPDGVIAAEAINEEGFLLTYDIRWAQGEESYKQVSVTAYKKPMIETLEAITRVYPLEDFINGGDGDSLYPPPSSLTIEKINGQVLLSWESPDTDLQINEYRAYRDNIFFTSTSPDTTSLTDDLVQEAKYYVTALYSDITESGPSNEVSLTENIEKYPAPQNLTVVSIEGEDENRTVTLQWYPPEPSSGVAGYNIYRKGNYIDSTDVSITSYVDHPGDPDPVNYYVTAIYEDGVESGPSEPVSG